MITSCLECRRRKLKCNKSHPCTNCVKFTRDCVFLAPALDQASQLKLTEIKEKVGSCMLSPPCFLNEGIWGMRGEFEFRDWVDGGNTH